MCAVQHTLDNLVFITVDDLNYYSHNNIVDFFTKWLVGGWFANCSFDPVWFTHLQSFKYGTVRDSILFPHDVIVVIPKLGGSIGAKKNNIFPSIPPAQCREDVMPKIFKSKTTLIDALLILVRYHEFHFSTHRKYTNVIASVGDRRCDSRCARCLRFWRCSLALLRVVVFIGFLPPYFAYCEQTHSLSCADKYYEFATTPLYWLLVVCGVDRFERVRIVTNSKQADG